VNVTPIPVASWAFYLEGEPISHHGEGALRQLAALVADAGAILYDQRLLLPASVELRSWRVPLGATADELTDAPDDSGEHVEFGPSALDGAALESLMVDAARARQSFPEQVQVSGSGVVHDGDTDRTAPDLIRLRGHAFVQCGVHVSTTADVWLPYDLRAEEQWDLCEANAPRLRRALRALGALPGVSISYEESTRYAVLDEDGVRNHFDYFGRPVAVID
jgi:hypothetical protein